MINLLNLSANVQRIQQKKDDFSYKIKMRKKYTKIGLFEPIKIRVDNNVGCYNNIKSIDSTQLLF